MFRLLHFQQPISTTLARWTHTACRSAGFLDYSEIMKAANYRPEHLPHELAQQML
jgi:hypothetical protein